MTFETNDNYSIRFEMKKKHYSHSTTKRTKFWKDDEVLRVALWTQDLRCAVTALFFIDPPLQAHLMHPPVRSAAPTRSYPQCVAVILLRREANPTCPIWTDTYIHTITQLMPLYSTSNNQSKHIGSLYLSVTPKFYTEVLHQTLNPTAELGHKTSSRIKSIWFYTEHKL